MAAGPRIFSGSSNPELAQKIADYIGTPLGALTKKKFSDGEIWVKFKENIRGGDVYLIQSTKDDSSGFQLQPAPS